MRVFLLLALLLASTSARSPLLRDTLAHTRADDGIDYRLPGNSAPTAYNVVLDAHIKEDNFTFNGNSSIELQVLEATPSLTLHINALTIDENSTSLQNANGTSYTVSNHTYDTTRQFLIIYFSTTLPVGNYTLELAFVGILNNDLAGFYRSSYVNDDGETIWLATTQFEPTSARRAFPCWDEPALKATFNIALKHFPNYTAISNMPSISQSAVDESDGKLYTIFETTPIMSTYLVAFLVSDFGYVANANETFNVWTRKSFLSTAEYALEVGQVILANLEEYTGVTYDLPKMDQAAIPDFSAGAMENWGLVTYRETYLLFEEGVSTTSDKQNIATVIAHEFAHQWFGNLVGPKWWNYLWLNEGFATYFQFYTTEQVVDNWRLMDQLVIRALQGQAFVSDGVSTSHPINNNVSSPSEISSTFDNIAYRKGASIIRMMAHFLSEYTFQSGLNKYLKANAYGAATSDDLWEALQEAANESYILPNHVYVKDVMDTWVEQMGYPVITATRNYTTTTMEISQQRFLLDQAIVDDDYRWWVPLTFVTQTNPDFSSTLATDWLRPQDESIIISGFNSSGWVIFNPQQTGYYRVNYDETNWGLITAYLNGENYLNIHVLNRAQLLDDALNLARSGRLDYSIVFNLLTYLVQEVDYIPWYSAFTGLTVLDRLLANTEEYESFRTFLLNLTDKLRKDVGYVELDEDEHVTKFNRINALTWSAKLGHVEHRSVATERIASWVENESANPLAPDESTYIYCAGLRGANATVWGGVLGKYLTSSSTTQKSLMLSGLGCAEDEDIVKSYMRLAITANSGLPNSSAAFASVYIGSVKNIDLALDFIIENLEEMITFYGGVGTIGTFLSGLGNRITTTAQYVKFTEFIDSNSAILGTASATGRTNMEANREWIEAYEPTIRIWLQNNYLAGETTPTVVTTEEPDSSTPASANSVMIGTLLLVISQVFFFFDV